MLNECKKLFGTDANMKFWCHAKTAYYWLFLSSCVAHAFPSEYFYRARSDRVFSSICVMVRRLHKRFIAFGSITSEPNDPFFGKPFSLPKISRFVISLSRWRRRAVLYHFLGISFIADVCQFLSSAYPENPSVSSYPLLQL